VSILIRSIVISLLLATSIYGLTGEAVRLPDKVELPVPFICQFPGLVSGMPWADACEEASIIMATHYARNEPLAGAASYKEIVKMIKYQQTCWGGQDNLSAKKAADLMSEYFDYHKYKIIYSFGIEDMRRELAQGNIILAPMAGQLLDNRYYNLPAPIFHYIVFTGYDDQTGEFITNDCGTKRGEGYRYKYQVAFNAIHDWNGSEKNIRKEKKAMIVVCK